MTPLRQRMIEDMNLPISRSGLFRSSLPAMYPLSARAAVPRLRIDSDRHSDALPHLADESGGAQRPRPEQCVILNPVPRDIAEDDETMRRSERSR